MKKLKIGLILTLLLTIATPAHAFFESINPSVLLYGKRSQTIDSIILNSLSTKDNVWIRTKVPYPDKINTWSRYSQECDDRENPKRKFIFSELNYGKSEKYRTLDDFIVKSHDSLKEVNSCERINYDKDGKPVKKSFLSKVNTVSKEAKEICLEVILYKVSQPLIQTKPTYDIFGNQTEGVSIAGGEECIDEIPTNYILYWIVDLGESKFRQYSYELSDRNPSEEEKTCIVNLFKHLEEQIKKVPS